MIDKSLPQCGDANPGGFTFDLEPCLYQQSVSIMD